MAGKKVMLQVLECLRCGKKWLPRKLDGTKPVECPKCKSQKWDKPKQK